MQNSKGFFLAQIRNLNPFQTKFQIWGAQIQEPLIAIKGPWKCTGTLRKYIAVASHVTGRGYYDWDERKQTVGVKSEG